MLKIVPLFVLVLIACGRQEQTETETVAPTDTMVTAPAEPPPTPPPAIETPGTDTTTAPVMSGAPACELLTAEQIREVTGIEVSPGEATSTGAPSQCSWNRVDGTEGGITVTLYDGEDAAKAFETLKVAGGTPIAGVAGDAIWHKERREVSIRKEERTATLTFSLDGVREEWATSLARLAADKL